MLDTVPLMSHRPHGSGHPYRYDLDQRVPVHPMAGEPFEVRVMTAAHVDAVEIRMDSDCGDTFGVDAEPVDPASLERDIGPFPARRTEEGHLAAAAEGGGLGADVRVWRATLTVAAPATYRVAVRAGGAISVGPDHRVVPVTWRPADDDLVAVGSDAGAAEGVPADRLIQGSVEVLSGADGPVRVRFALRLDDGQHVIGLGERYATLDHRGEMLDCVVFEQYKHQGRRTYLPVPMAVVVGGDHWGFHVGTSRRTWFDIGATSDDRIVVEAEVERDDPAIHLDLWRGEPGSLVRRFLARTGVPPRPPAWIFEPWMSANEWNTQARVEAEVSRSLDEDIPVGVVVIEAWSDESTFVAFRDAEYPVHPDGEPHRLADFTFPRDGAWPDPVGMVGRLHDAGVRVLLWQIPLVPTDRGDAGQIAADVDALQRLGLCVREADGSPHRNRGWWFPGALLPDFTNPEARRWWSDRRRYLLEEVGIDGFKTDGGEHLWGHDLVFADGTRGAESNNRFPVLFARTYHDLFRETGSDGVTFSRAGFTGSAAYPCHWAGDDDSTWEGVPAAIRAGLGAGVAGIWFWTWDLAGFSGPIPDAELYARSAAVAAFCPIMQYHAEFNHHRTPSNDRTPWNIAERTGDLRALSVYRRFAHLRRRLVPYLVEQVERSLASGKPLMRPLCFDHPDDELIWSYPLQFQLGDSLLVAPVTTQGADSIRVYLPTGEWVDCFTGSTHVGPVAVERTVPWDEVAVYRRAGDLDDLLAAAFRDLPDPSPHPS